ncbi:MAG: glycolate oxidase subunit GlcF [Gammaproteobacteria bacterium]|nr:glycolate oxidase subunit GlcF [Gammaproteobacteria bacterium]
MKTDFPEKLLATDSGRRANEILRNCVHCGFCNATCPTYQLTGNELDGPRGRIYLIKDLLETGENTQRATHHLDRCLTCLACESTCPSGVAYGELAEIARSQIGAGRTGVNGLLRTLLKWMVPHATRLRLMSRVGRLFRFLLPQRLASSVPDRVGAGVVSNRQGERKVLLLNGCAQQVSTSQTNIHLQKILTAHNVGSIVADSEVCCGSLDLHLGDSSAGLAFVRANVDAIYPLLDEVEVIVSSATGCGVTLKDYGRLLSADAEYAERAAAVADRVVDVAEYLVDFQLTAVDQTKRVAWHSPCTLQHGQKLLGGVEYMLHSAGYELVPVEDAHLCCGSAGPYSMLQPQLSQKLKTNKVNALQKHQPDIIATANVGCQVHLNSASSVPVVHWIELLQ